MDRKSKFFICKNCKNLASLIHFSGESVCCCNKEMENLNPITEGVGKEKHLPRVSISGNKVTVNVGEITHPMTDEHVIAWVYLVTKFGEQRKFLVPGDKPELTFVLDEDDIPIAAYAYCNLHGLWKTQINKSNDGM